MERGWRGVVDKADFLHVGIAVTRRGDGACGGWRRGCNGAGGEAAVGMRRRC